MRSRCVCAGQTLGCARLHHCLGAFLHSSCTHSFTLQSFVYARPQPHTPSVHALFLAVAASVLNCSSPLFFASRCAHRLLSLGIQNIHIGPAAPAFVTPGILKVLQDKYKLQYIDSENYEADLQKMLQGM
eukprot:TRINITY_DN25_c0_g1_i1.p2 TRINITY_DN25_c0_g1~~TRINITY_DN25_c0_g1_i1.p2  ORF type:complete len:130 (+),score=19.51 TRINITY_DN25_c0_g1_i1:1052-1441(+)